MRWRMQRAVLVAAVLIGVGACGSSGLEPSSSSPESAASSTPPGGEARGSPGGDTPIAVLSLLSVREKVPLTGYSRDLYGQAWTDDNSNPLGRNGCDERNNSLKRALTAQVIKPGTHGCVVLSGTLVDPYTGKVVQFVRGPDSAAVQVDHVVPLANSYQTGAQQLSAAERQDFATDPLNLITTDGPTNQAKGDGDASEWLPPRNRCLYVARQIAVKAKWHLWVTGTEKAAMQSVLAGCPATPMPTETSSDVISPIPDN